VSGEELLQPDDLREALESLHLEKKGREMQSSGSTHRWREPGGKKEIKTKSIPTTVFPLSEDL